MTVRVRYAPSPTGHLHIGGVRTALFNYFFAKHYHGDFILRFEDTDIDRNVPGAEEEMLRGFRWLGFDWAEGPDVGGPYGPYRCTERLPLYEEYLAKLVDAKLAYPCYCSKEELEEERHKAEQEGGMPKYSGKCKHLTPEQRAEKEALGIQPNYRFAVPEGVQLAFDDLVRGHVVFETNDIGDYVIVKSNGIPTYNFQVVVDDTLMKITHVIRGEEHLSNTPKQLLIYQALSFEPPAFGHLPQVLNHTRKKLSKRDPNVMPVHKYREQGYLPSALVNFLALLGWSPVGEQEIMTMDEIISAFDMDRVNKSGAIFDVDKLRWMANQYFKQIPVEDATQKVQALLPVRDWVIPADSSEGWLPSVVNLYQEQMSCAADFLNLAENFFDEQITYEEEAVQVMKEEGAKQVITKYLELASSDDTWTPEASKARFKQIQKELGVKGRGLFMPVRAAITGMIHGRDLQRTIAYLPKTWVINRLEKALSLL
jgi:nondiscriminating glutamyl-tRNA synthetase